MFGYITTSSSYKKVYFKQIIIFLIFSYVHLIMSSICDKKRVYAQNVTKLWIVQKSLYNLASWLILHKDNAKTLVMQSSLIKI